MQYGTEAIASRAQRHGKRQELKYPSEHICNRETLNPEAVVEEHKIDNDRQIRECADHCGNEISALRLHYTGERIRRSGEDDHREHNAHQFGSKLLIRCTFKAEQ